MKKVVEVTEVDGEGFEALMGQDVLVFCANYIYAGKLSGVDETCIQLEHPSIVYETGAFDSKGYKDAQKLPADNWYIQLSAVESFGAGK